LLLCVTTVLSIVDVAIHESVVIRFDDGILNVARSIDIKCM